MQSSTVNECFEQLVTQHQREIYLYIARLTRGSHEADDLFQETFLRAYRAYARLPEEANTRAWLFKIATNLCRNHFRRLRRRQDIGMQEALTVVERARDNGAGAAPDDPAQLVLSHDMEQQMLAIIDGLPVKQKAALIQRKLHGLPYDSIAHSLQCSQEAARAHVFQALKKIRLALELVPSSRRQLRRPDEHRPARKIL